MVCFAAPGMNQVLSHCSRVWLFATLWTVARQAPLSKGFSRQEYWSGLPFLFPGDLPDPRIEPESLTSPPLGGGFFNTSATMARAQCNWEAEGLVSHPASSFTTNCDPGQLGLSPCKMVRAVPPCPIQRLMKWSKELIKDKALYRLLKHILQKVLLWQRFRGPMFPTVRWCMCLIMAYSLQPVVCSPPDSSVHGILQAKILEWDPLLQGSFQT